MATATTKDEDRLYFGYGSNLWKDQMLRRCPRSSFSGIARLTGYRWIINERGYANIVQSQSKSWAEISENVVWALVYSLTPSDEARLDPAEGVPFAYTKEIMTTDFWAAAADGKAKVEGDGEKRDVLVYIDRLRITPSGPNDEYVDRMNSGIEDALRSGVPSEYVDDIMRKFIPVSSRTMH